MLQNNTNDISITILENQNDIEQNVKSLRSRKAKSLAYSSLKFALIIHAIVVMLMAVLSVLYIIEGNSGTSAVIFIISTVVCALLAVFLIKSLSVSRKKSDKAYINSRLAELGNSPLPVKYTFTEDGIYSESPIRTAEAAYRDIEYVTEFADGIFIHMTAPFFAYYIWLPSRYFTKEAAEGLTALLREKSGKKYTMESPLAIPESCADAGKIVRIEPKGEKLMDIEVEYIKMNVVKGIISSIFVRIKKSLIYIALLIVAYFASGFVGNILKFGKYTAKIVRLIAKYTQLGGVISQADMIDTAQSLLVTAIGMLISLFVLILIVSTAVIAVQRIIFTLKEYRSGKKIIDSDKSVEIYDDAVVSRRADNRYVMLWDTVQKAVKKNNRVDIFDNRNRYAVVTLCLLEKEQKQLLFEILNERLGRNWHKPQAAITAAENAVYKADTYGTNADQ